jgi:FdhD protein
MFTRKVKITQIRGNDRKIIDDVVLIEVPIEITINSKPFATIICLPKNLKELAVGFLYFTEIIKTVDDIEELQINENNSQINIILKENNRISQEAFSLNPLGRVVDTTSGISPPWRKMIEENLDSDKIAVALQNQLMVGAETISNFISKMQSETTLFKQTGGCHGCAIFSKNGKLLTLMEDIGRHNAIDKAIGDLIFKKHPLKNVILCSTGRLTGDTVLKAVRAKIPIVASVSTAIDSGIRLADAYGTTLIGFVREHRMNIYTHPFRIS